ncbi:MAG: TIGR01777 family oxidoreductase [Verrucomicrobiota bacterium]|nr:TIGR01777 family oxidoreductase [Verrucomicrobiota bacterium]
MSKIVLAGGSGFLGQTLSNHLEESGKEVVILGRSGQSAARGISGRFVEWDAKSLGSWQEELEEAEALFNLCGRSVDCRYDERNKRLILKSRVDSTRILGEAVQACSRPPKVWLNASTATLYQDRRGDLPPHDENSVANAVGFSEEVGRAWEEAFFASARDGVRQVAMRISIVLGNGGGAFPVMRRLTRLGLGGAQGPGSQWMSWLHIEDWVGIARFLMETESVVGPVNLAAPNPVTNSSFMRAMRKRFAPFGLGLPAPTPLIHLGAVFLRTEPELVLKSRKVRSKVLDEQGYSFVAPTLEVSLGRLEKMG